MRRALEKISAEMVRCAHRAITKNTTFKGYESFVPEPLTDPSVDEGGPSEP